MNCMKKYRTKLLAWKAIALDNPNPGIGSSNGINVPERSDMKSDLDLTSNLAFKLNKALFRKG